MYCFSTLISFDHLYDNVKRKILIHDSSDEKFIIPHQKVGHQLLHFSNLIKIFLINFYSLLVREIKNLSIIFTI